MSQFFVGGEASSCVRVMWITWGARVQLAPFSEGVAAVQSFHRHGGHESVRVFLNSCQAHLVSHRKECN